MNQTKTIINNNIINSFFNSIEEEYDLINHTIDKVYFWKLIRYSLREKIVEKSGLMSTATPLPYNNKIDKIIKMARRDFDIIKYNALNYKDKKKIIIFQKSRKIFYQGEEVDIFTHFFIEELKNNQFDNYITFETDTFDSKYYKKYNPYIALEPIFFQKIKSLFNKVELDKAEIDLLNLLSKTIKNKFGIEIDVKLMAIKAVKYFKQQYVYYERLFKTTKPQKIIVLASQSKAALIAAAQTLKIEVIEIQHGSISNNHFGYSFPNNKKVPYFPDKMLVFGEYWSISTNLPLSYSNVHIVGYPYLIEQLNKYKKVKKEEKTIVFISQTIVADKLIKVAIEFAEKFKDYQLIYKLHPTEYRDYKKMYPELIKAVNLDNFEVVDNNHTSLHEILAKSSFQVGVGSTAILEGLCLNCKTVLIDLPGIEELNYLIDGQIVMKAQDVNELYECITNFKGENYNRNYFFAEFDNMPISFILDDL